jgi:hypothetical protein
MNNTTVSVTVNVDLAGMSDRQLEAVDHAVSLLRDLPGVTVKGWCDEE